MVSKLRNKSSIILLFSSFLRIIKCSSQMFNTSRIIQFNHKFVLTFFNFGKQIKFWRQQPKFQQPVKKMSKHKKHSHQYGHPQEFNLFLQIPSEILIEILEFVVDTSLSDRGTVKNSIRMMAIFESLSCRLNSRLEMREYLNNFWWKVFELEQPESNSKEIEKAKLEMIKKNCLKRKILLTRHARRTLLHPVSENRAGDIRIFVTGCRKSGKTSIINSFVHEFFDPNYGLTYVNIVKHSNPS